MLYPFSRSFSAQRPNKCSVSKDLLVDRLLKMTHRTLGKQKDSKLATQLSEPICHVETHSTRIDGHSRSPLVTERMIFAATIQEISWDFPARDCFNLVPPFATNTLVTWGGWTNGNRHSWKSASWAMNCPILKTNQAEKSHTNQAGPPRSPGEVAMAKRAPTRLGKHHLGVSKCS